MKVILLQDVAKLGRKHDVVTVPDGYGMNKLVPKGMAKPATPENLKAAQKQAAASASAKADSDAAFAELVAALDGTPVTLAVEANDEGRLFQAVKPEQIAAAVAAATGTPVDASLVVVEAPIKSVGDHGVVIASGAASTKVTVHITPA
mgnify:CR=1 FL=1